MGQPPPNDSTPTQDVLASYTGVYRISKTENIAVILDQNHLALEHRDGHRVELIPLSISEFTRNDTGAHHLFVRNEAGQVDKLVYRPMVGPEKIDPRINEPLIKPTITVVPAILDSYVGTYQADDIVLEIRRKGSLLETRSKGPPHLKLTPRRRPAFARERSRSRLSSSPTPKDTSTAWI